MGQGCWICNVCGYIHQGEELPDCCPVCGATPEHFTPCPPPLASATATPAAWRCLNCDYLHHGTMPPATCPVCGVGPEQFEPGHPTAAAETRTDGSATAIVVIGGGIAGLSAAAAARKSSPAARISLLLREEDLPYYRLNLTRYLAGEITADELPIHPIDWYAAQGIELRRACEVIAIDPGNRTITLRTGESLPYDKLILATGAHPATPAIDGVRQRNVAMLRTRRDADWLLAHTPGKPCVIIGGGVLGLETAAALARRGAQVTLLEGFDWLLPRQLNRAASAHLQRVATDLGITVVCGARIRALDGDRRVRSVVLDAGRSFPAEVVVIAAGVRCNSYLARMAGLTVNQGVVVDDHLRTSDPDIYAVGDVAEHQGILYGTWAPAQYQGTIAGLHAAGEAARFAGIPRSNILKVLGIDMFSIGQVHPDDASYTVFEEDAANYAAFVFRDLRLVGAILIGDMTIAPDLKHLIENRVSCAELLAETGNAALLRERIGKAGR